MLDCVKTEIQISIHAPRVGSDPESADCMGQYPRFQSTLPVWGATMFCAKGMMRVEIFQSTLPVWGATWWAEAGSSATTFQSTLPVWGATYGM